MIVVCCARTTGAHPRQTETIPTQQTFKIICTQAVVWYDVDVCRRLDEDDVCFWTILKALVVCII